jgi:hypothetical protein
VGLFAHWVSVKGTAEALVEAGYGEIVEAETPGWLTGYRGDDMQLPEWGDLEDAVARVAASAGGPALGSWVYDSDVGYLAAVDDHGVPARLVINPDACEAYSLSLPEGWPDRAIARFAEWSTGAPNPLDTARLVEIVERDWTFAEEGVTDLHERLGLSTPYETHPDLTVPAPLPRATVDAIDARSFGGYEVTLPWMTEAFIVGSRLVPWRNARYVPGAWADFIGIWDRDGYGAGFLGIWDRERPSAPINQFSADHVGMMEAYETVRRLLFEGVLARKELPGLRLYLPRVQPRIVQQQISPDLLDHIQGLSPEQRAAWEENLKRGPWFRSPAGPWLLTEEDEDEAWTPSVSGTGRFYLYASGFTDALSELNLICQGNFPTEEVAREIAARRYAQGEWREVPEEVPRNLLETVRWLLADG